jgi:flagellar hook-associated protein 1 FlgK
LESIIGELSDTDLSTSLNRFFASINDVLNQPEDPAVRNLAILQGQTLSDDIKRLSSRVRQIRQDVNEQIVSAADDINRLTAEIAELNIQIVALEGTSTTGSDAGGLRDQRNIALSRLSEIIGVRTAEQPSGAITVFAGGDFLVFDGTTRPVGVVFGEDRGMATASINILDSDAPIQSSSGNLAGLYSARDTNLGGFLDELDGFAQNLIFEFNKVFSSGQGLTGYSTATSRYFVQDSDEPLDQAGLNYTPVNGSFQLLVKNSRTGITTTSDIRVDLNGLGEDTSLADLAEQLNAVEGISAMIDESGRLKIDADSPVLEFSFAQDTSGILAALGINTFFEGESAGNIGVDDVIVADPLKFAASQGGIGEDTANAVLLAGFASTPLAAVDGRTLLEEYERITGATFQASAAIQAINEGFQTFHKTLEGQQLGISGVNIDEQAVKMIQFQRIYQASARVIAAIDELLETLINL